MIARRSPPPSEVGTLDKETMTRVQQTMRTTISIALNKMPGSVRKAYAGPGGVPGYLEVERARQAIAEHLVVEIGKVLDVRERPWVGPPPAIEYGPKKA